MMMPPVSLSLSLYSLSSMTTNTLDPPSYLESLMESSSNLGLSSHRNCDIIVQILNELPHPLSLDGD